MIKPDSFMTFEGHDFAHYVTDEFPNQPLYRTLCDIEITKLRTDRFAEGKPGFNPCPRCSQILREINS